MLLGTDGAGPARRLPDELEEALRVGRDLRPAERTCTGMVWAKFPLSDRGGHSRPDRPCEPVS